MANTEDYLEQLLNGAASGIIQDPINLEKPVPEIGEEYIEENESSSLVNDDSIDDAINDLVSGISISFDCIIAFCTSFKDIPANLSFNSFSILF